VIRQEVRDIASLVATVIGDRRSVDAFPPRSDAVGAGDDAGEDMTP
jgi:hypothetical protein